MTKDKQQSILYTFTTLLQTILSMFLGWCNFCTYQEFYHIFYKFTYNQLIIVVCAEFAHTTIISLSSIYSLRKITTFSRTLQIIPRISFHLVQKLKKLSPNDFLNVGAIYIFIKIISNNLNYLDEFFQ